MTNAPDEKLAAALTDVRRAYRLLWAYQRRVLDYYKVVCERLSFTDLGTSSLVGPPGQTGNVVWAQLPMVDVEFRAVRRHKDGDYPSGKPWAQFPRKNDTVLYLRVRSDTGMGHPALKDPNPLTFKPAELCQTKLLLFVILNRLDREQAASLWTAGDVCRTAAVGREKESEQPTIDGYSIFGMDVDLSALPDEIALVDWIDGFKEAAETALGVIFSDLPGHLS